jgi:hypothetical protein
MLIPRGLSVALAAAETAYADCGHYQEGFDVLEAHLAGTLVAGAVVVATLQVSVDGDTYYDAKFVDLTNGTSTSTLVASLSKNATFTTQILRMVANAPWVRLKLDNSGGSAAATITGNVVVRQDA